MRVFTTTTAEQIATIEPFIPPVAQAAKPRVNQSEADGSTLQPDDPSNVKGQPQVARDLDSETAQPDHAVSTEAKPDFKALVFTTQYGVRHQVPVDQLGFHKSVADRKGDPDAKEAREPWQKVVNGDWLVTEYDVKDDELIHRVYDDKTFNTLFRQALN